jgi:dihydrofolate synthase/folylpolyglutamate synthase
MGLRMLDAWQRLDRLVDWERSDRTAMRPSLLPQQDLLHRLGEPQRAVRTVHVTGTKGKGSVCALIEAGLLHAGLRAGRYASPHVLDITERISLLGRPVQKDRMAAALARVLDARESACEQGSAGRDASWFDIVTAAAFVIFADEGLDWAVIEVGIGGRLDSTNVIEPELAIVTNIGLEHTEVLGNTVEAIAREKGGIIKTGRPVLTGLAAQDPAGAVLREIAAARGSALHAVDVQACAGFSEANLAMARAALGLLGEAGFCNPRSGQPLSAADLPAPVVAAVSLPGRAQVFDVPLPADSGGVLRRVVVDGAHVAFAVAALLAQCRREARHAAVPVVLLALSPDKDAAEIIARLPGQVRTVVCCELGAQRRAWPATALATLCGQHGLRALAVPDPAQALATALQMLVTRDDWLLATGSLYLAAALHPLLQARGARAAAASFAAPVDHEAPGQARRAAH